MSEGRDDHGRFSPGNAGGPGRQVGQRPHRNVAGEERLRAFYDTVDLSAKLKELIDSKDERIRLDTIKFIHEQLHGRAAQRVSLTGADGADLEIQLHVERRDFNREAAPAPRDPTGTDEP